MSTWTETELATLETSHELGLASQRADGTLRPYVTMWMVRVDDGVYVRSAYGPDNPWFRRARKSGTGRVRAGGVERNVAFVDADPGVHQSIDDAYHAKHDQYGPRIVGSVVGPEVRAVTLRLDPTESPSQATDTLRHSGG